MASDNYYIPDKMAIHCRGISYGRHLVNCYHYDSISGAIPKRGLRTGVG